LQKMWSIAFESRIFRVIWSFTKFIKSDESDDAADSISFMKRLIINVISSVIDDLLSEWWFWNNQKEEKEHFFEDVNSMY
jgi:hypothetical protein